jgi:hypothetical protein
MQKKKWLLLALILGLILVGGGLFLIFNPFNKPSSLISPMGADNQEKEVALKVWEDPAGFNFSYFEGIEIDNHEEDEENYAHLELTSQDYPGSILVWVKDKTEKNLDDWVTNQEGSPQVLDSELGGQPAKKMAFLSPKKMMTVAFDQEVVIIVEVFPENEWWDKAYQQVIESFELVPLEKEDKAKVNAPGAWEGSGGDSGIIDEGEEIVE